MTHRCGCHKTAPPAFPVGGQDLSICVPPHHHNSVFCLCLTPCHYPETMAMLASDIACATWVSGTNQCCFQPPCLPLLGDLVTLFGTYWGVMGIKHQGLFLRHWTMSWSSTPHLASGNCFARTSHSDCNMFTICWSVVTCSRTTMRMRDGAFTHLSTRSWVSSSRTNSSARCASNALTRLSPCGTD